MHWEIVAGAVALGLVGEATSSFAQEVTLRYRWTKGEETRTRMTQQVSTTISTAIPGGPGNGSVESSMSQVFHTIVEDVAAEGTATLCHRAQRADPADPPYISCRTRTNPSKSRSST